MPGVASIIWSFVGSAFGIFVAIVAGVILGYLVYRKKPALTISIVFCVAVIGFIIFLTTPRSFSQVFAVPNMPTYGSSTGPGLPFANVLAFLKNLKNFERVADVARDPRDVGPTVTRTGPQSVEVLITAQEVLGEMAPGVWESYWTFGGTIPGPLLKIREGDTVRLTLSNDKTSLHHHSIDLHAVTGPGGGAAATIVAPGESKTITFKALNPGLFIYHCAHPNAAVHMAHGMYGLILVEPKEGLTPVDAEFYVVQGEFYNTGPLGEKGLQMFDAVGMLEGKPQYVVFNGRTGALSDNMIANVGDTLRFYMGNGGVNFISSFHIIGEIFDKVYREGDLVNAPAESVQTTLIPAGGAAMIDLKVEYPGNYILVDHALSRMDRGAWGVLHVEGPEDSTIFSGEVTPGHGH